MGLPSSIGCPKDLPQFLHDHQRSDDIAMVAIGTRINEIGTLVRDGGAFYLRRDVGGRYELELNRTPVDMVEKRVRLIGTLVGPDLVNADGVAPA